LYCHYCSVMHVTVMPVSAYMALAFVFGFIPNKLMMMMMIYTHIEVLVLAEKCPWINQHITWTGRYQRRSQELALECTAVQC